MDLPSLAPYFSARADSYAAQSAALRGSPVPLAADLTDDELFDAAAQGDYGRSAAAFQEERTPELRFSARTGFTALHAAVMSGHTAVLNLLLSKLKGGWVRAESCTSAPFVSLLHLAVALDQRDAVAALLTAGCDPHATDAHDWTPLAIANYLGSKGVVALLRSAISSTMAVPPESLHPLLRARPIDAAPASVGPLALPAADSLICSAKAEASCESWVMMLSLGALPTIAGTYEQPAVVLEPGALERQEDAAPAAESSQRGARRAYVCVRNKQPTSPEYVAVVQLHGQPTGSGSGCRWSSGTGDKTDARHPTGMQLHRLQWSSPSTAASSSTVAAYEQFDTTMVFTTDSLDSNNCGLDLEFVLRIPGVGDTATVQAAPTLAAAVLPAALLSGLSTATVNPASTGVENMAMPLSASAASAASAAAAPATAATSAAAPARLSGQLLLPLISTTSPVTAVGALAVRYMLYRVPLAIACGDGAAVQPSFSAPAAAVSAEAAASDVTDSRPALSRLATAGSFTDVILPTAGVAGSADKPVQLPKRSPTSQRSFWSSGTRIVGHRGSGADNAAVVTLPPEEAGTAPATTISTAPPVAPATTASAAAVAPVAASSSGPLKSPTRRRTHILENTLLSLTRAAAAGADFAEFDAQLTRDGVPVVHHDWGVRLPTLHSPPRGSAGAAASRSFGEDSFSSSAGISLDAVPPIRIPITHLTVAQLAALQPQVMVNDVFSDETAVARAADAASRNFKPKQLPASSAAASASIRRAPSTGTLPTTSASTGSLLTAATTTTSSSLSVAMAPANGGMQHQGGAFSDPGAFRSPPLPPAPAPAPALPLAVQTAAVPLSLPQTSPPASSPGAVSSSPLLTAMASGAYDGDDGVSNKRTLSALGLDAGRIDSTRLSIRYQHGLRDRFATLQQVLERVPVKCGFNIEVKYATTAESHLFGLRQMERNAFVERILDVVSACAGSRSIMFSSFDPDICALLGLKQQRYPVFFLTEAGTHDEGMPLDPRMTSLAAAVAWARTAGLMGIVAHVPPLLETPRLFDAVQREAGLVLATYGRANNTLTAVALQRAYGVGAVIVDHVTHVLRGGSSSSSSSSGSGSATALTASTARGTVGPASGASS